MSLGNGDEVSEINQLQIVKILACIQFIHFKMTIRSIWVQERNKDSKSYSSPRNKISKF